MFYEYVILLFGQETMIILPFKIEHLSQLDIRLPGLVGMNIDRAYEEIPKFNQAGPAFSVFSDDRLLIVIAGVGIIWEGVGVAWTVPSIYVDDYKLSFHKAVKDYLEKIIESNNLHRVQCYVHKDYDVSQKWVKRLGFYREGLLKQFGSDKADYYIYARLV